MFQSNITDFMTENDIKNSVIGFFAHLSDFSVLRRKIISCRFYKIHCVLRGRAMHAPTDLNVVLNLS